jgi:muconolactone delta-isomerase
LGLSLLIAPVMVSISGYPFTSSSPMTFNNKKGLTMSSTADPTEFRTFIVVATIREDTDFAEMMALRADEQKRIAVLQSEGKIGADHVAPSRATAFLEVLASDEEHVMETLTTLPFHPFFDVDIFPIAAPDDADVRQS